MQLAYTAKHNSGCISRHVGAAITDEEYSIKAIGWNNTPAGQVPCSLRNATDLTDPNPLRDTIAFTNYERGVDNNQSKEYEAFKSILNENFDTKVKQNSHLLKGRNVCFCFRSLKNSMSEGKNQVHTRSLHAEENAFLQLTKYGGAGIRNGILFSTASPCELCSKKAYQLGIMIIYYIDPYPGISKSHILSSGENPIEIRLFNGAIGSTYHQLYQIIMPYKDELALLLDHNIKDMASKLQDQLKRKDDENARLKAKIEELEAKSKTK
ncbi:MAG: dCMP deaminase [Flavobacteriaceae bacterium]|nr:dCMP deaminase [Flavobacteriaceae bacterium]